jgi:hypothetical protein
LLGVCHCSCLRWPACLFTVPWGIFPFPLFGTQGGPPSLLRVFFFVVYYSVWFFSLFSLGGVWSVQGAMLTWPRVVCGSTTFRLGHLMVCFSQASRSWHLVAWEPSWFLHLMWSGDAMSGLGLWRSQHFPSLSGFSCNVYLQLLSKILF